MGGVVAFEMACQLQAQGEEVAKLVMFDSYPPGAYLKQNSQSLFGRFLTARRIFSNRENKTAHQGSVLFDTLGLLLKIVSRKIKSVFEMLSIKLFRYFRFRLPYKYRYDYIRSVHLKALNIYLPSNHFDGDITYFKAMDEDNDYQNPVMEWKRFFKGILIVKEVTGSHQNLMENGELAKYLESCLV